MHKNTAGRSPLQPGFDAPLAPTDRLFFAIFPDSAAALQLERLAEQLRSTHGLKGKPLQTERFHITLHHLGDFVGLPPHIVAMAMEAGASMAGASFPSHWTAP